MQEKGLEKGGWGTRENKFVHFKSQTFVQVLTETEKKGGEKRRRLEEEWKDGTGKKRGSNTSEGGIRRGGGKGRGCVTLILLGTAGAGDF